MLSSCLPQMYNSNFDIGQLLVSNRSIDWDVKKLKIEGSSVDKKINLREKIDIKP